VASLNSWVDSLQNAGQLLATDNTVNNTAVAQEILSSHLAVSSVQWASRLQCAAHALNLRRCLMECEHFSSSSHKITLIYHSVHQRDHEDR
jgi:hypothetical protein